jgi:hypothetical protein
MRVIRVDSVLPLRNPASQGPTVATLRLDASNFDFSLADSTGGNLAVQRLDGSSIPFEIVFWDKRSSLGRIHVRIDSALRAEHSSFLLRWDLPRSARSDSAAVWQGFTSAQVLLLNSVLVDDFEDGALRNQLPDSAAWTDTATASASFSNFGILADPAGQRGKVLHFAYSADSVSGQYVLVKTSLAATPRCMRSMDSLVMWVRCSGVFTVAMENSFGKSTSKAWVNWRFDSTQWNRVRVRPEDFLPADKMNVGWLGVRDSITSLTLFMTGTGDFWLDSIRIYGINPDDLR